MVASPVTNPARDWRRRARAPRVRNPAAPAAGCGVGRSLVPRPALPPDHPLALADARHPITEAGLTNLTARLIGFRRMDLDDPGAVTIVDRTHDEQGRPWLRSLHEHPVYDP